MSPHTPPGQTRERVYRSVRERLERLVSEGRLGKQLGIARGYCLPPGETAGSPPILISVLGRVQAGAFAPALEDIKGHIPMRTRTAEGIFGLRIRGEGMTGAGILPGDIVIREQLHE